MPGEPDVELTSNPDDDSETNYPDEGSIGSSRHRTNDFNPPQGWRKCIYDQNQVTYYNQRTGERTPFFHDESVDAIQDHFASLRNSALSEDDFEPKTERVTDDGFSCGPGYIIPPTAGGQTPTIADGYETDGGEHSCFNSLSSEQSEPETLVSYGGYVEDQSGAAANVAVLNSKDVGAAPQSLLMGGRKENGSADGRKPEQSSNAESKNSVDNASPEQREQPVAIPAAPTQNELESTVSKTDVETQTTDLRRAAIARKSRGQTTTTSNPAVSPSQSSKNAASEDFSVLYDPTGSSKTEEGFSCWSWTALLVGAAALAWKWFTPAPSTSWF